jgi:hypothetical protein
MQRLFAVVLAVACLVGSTSGSGAQALLEHLAKGFDEVELQPMQVIMAELHAMKLTMRRSIRN